jgi:hypothetical protein
MTPPPVLKGVEEADAEVWAAAVVVVVCLVVTLA